jgi:hypothetical protein
LLFEFYIGCVVAFVVGDLHFEIQEWIFQVEAIDHIGIPKDVLARLILESRARSFKVYQPAIFLAITMRTLVLA